MAESEHNVKININGNPTSAIGALKGVVSALDKVRSAASKIMSAFGVFGLAVQGVQALIQGFKWLRDKITETSRAIAKMRFDNIMRSAANETARLVSFHERLAKLMKDELDTISKQRTVAAIGAQGKTDYESGKREAERARLIYEAKTPEEEQALRDRFAAEDEQRARRDSRAARAQRIDQLDEEESVYASKARGLRENNAGITAQIATNENLLERAGGNETYAGEIRKRLEALRARKAANEAEIAQFEKEAQFRRDQIAALRAVKDYDGETAGSWNRKTEAKKRAEEQAKAEAEAAAKVKAEAERESAKAAADARAQTIADMSAKSDLAKSRAGAIAAFDGVSANRLTAMGLGSGVSAEGKIPNQLQRISRLLEEQIRATKENKPTDQHQVAVYGE